RKYELEDNEWVILQQLRDILKVCTLCLTLWRICLCYIVCSCWILKDATLYFLCATPNLATVIPAMDHVDKMLMSYSHNKIYLPSIHSAVQLVKK
ncbi:uncharacterized protein F5147DRAFT_555513, partial [Suillus discolor]